MMHLPRNHAILLKPKLTATSIHLAISLSIFVVLALFIYLAWYPQPYFAYAGGWQGIKIIAAVDLTIGPLLTLIVFNPDKTRRAKTIDYSFIILAQTAALSWGIYATYTQRPVAVVYHDGIFEAHTSDIFEDQEIDGRPLQLTDLARLSDEQPPLIYARKAETEAEQAGVFTWEFIEGVPEHGLAFLFEPLAPNMEHLIKRQQKHLESIGTIPHIQKRLHNLLKTNNLNRNEIILAPFEGRYGSAWMVLSQQARLLGFI